MPPRQFRSRPTGLRRRQQSRNPRRTQGKESKRISFGALVALGGATGLFAGAMLISYDPPAKVVQDGVYSAIAAGSNVANLPVNTTEAPAPINQPLTVASTPAQSQFEVCGSVRETCVVDGETFWLDGVKIRLADIDTPEIGSPKCEGEYQLGMKAKQRLLALLNEGPFELQTSGDRDTDRYGRQLRVAVRNGASIGDQLVAEGLAHKWIGSKQPWC